MLNALAVNVIIIWIILEAGKEQQFGCDRTSCKRYYNLDNFRSRERTTVLDVIALAVNVIII